MIDNITLTFIFYCIQLFCQYSPSRQMQDAAMSVWLRGLLRPIYQDGWLRRGDHWLIPDHSFREVFLQNSHSFDCFMFFLHSTFKHLNTQGSNFDFLKSKEKGLTLFITSPWKWHQDDWSCRPATSGSSFIVGLLAIPCGSQSQFFTS